MKKIFFVILLASIFLSCKKDSIMQYEGVSSIYFVLPFDQFYPADSMVISFAAGSVTATDSIVNIPVRIMGALSSSPREFKVTVSDSSTAKLGVDYSEISNTIIRANSSVDTLKVKILRTEAMQTNSAILYLNLVENENFATPMKSSVINSSTGKVLHYTQMKIIVNDILTKPMRWLDAYLGPFSRKKVYLMTEVLGVSMEDIIGISDIGKEQFWGRYMQLYLNDKRDSGNTVYEEDGVTPMIMGASVQ